MNEELIQQFFKWIDSLTSDQKPSFGMMNANQMLCHCADFFRMAKGIKKAEEYGKVDPDNIISLAKLGKPTPAPKGFGQVEGTGTKPTILEYDKRILKEYLLEFSKLSEDHNLAIHPYFGKIDRKRWNGLAIYHLNHHLGQFNV